MILRLNGLGDDDSGGSGIDWASVGTFATGILNSGAATQVAAGVGRAIAPPPKQLYVAPAAASSTDMTKPLLIGAGLLVGALVLMKARG